MPRREDITDLLPNVSGTVEDIEAAAKEIGYTDLLIKQEDGQYRIKGFYRLRGLDRWKDTVIRRYGSMEAYRAQQKLLGAKSSGNRKK